MLLKCVLVAGSPLLFKKSFQTLKQLFPLFYFLKSHATGIFFKPHPLCFPMMPQMVFSCSSLPCSNPTCQNVVRSISHLNFLFFHGSRASTALPSVSTQRHNNTSSQSSAACISVKVKGESHERPYNLLIRL